MSVVLPVPVMVLHAARIRSAAAASPRKSSISAAMMLDFLGEADAAERIKAACTKASALDGSTTDIGDHVADLL